MEDNKNKNALNDEHPKDVSGGVFGFFIGTKKKKTTLADGVDENTDEE